MGQRKLGSTTSAVLGVLLALALCETCSRAFTSVLKRHDVARGLSSSHSRPIVARKSSRYDPPRDLKPPAGAQMEPSGLASQVLSPGTGGGRPGSTSEVKVHYTGWTSRGQMFDSSYMKNQPAVFKLNEVIPGWTEGVALMEAGEKRRLWIPGNMAYGEEEGFGFGGGPPKGDLVFDVELISFESPGDPILTFFGGAAAVLAIGTTIFSAVNVPPERPEYDTAPLISFNSFVRPYQNNDQP